MTGNNTIDMCPALMAEIVQHYFNTVLFAAGKAPKVTGVGHFNNIFRVTMNEAGKKTKV